jgi:TolA-binding protein
VIAIIVVAVRGRRISSAVDAEISAGPPSFEVEDAVGAEWFSEVTGSEVRTRLSGGAASFHVERTRSGQRFLLQMPDAQIEVHGTRFRVEVRDGTTQRVEVSEGLVTFRRRSEPERRLYAGEIWDALLEGEATMGDERLAGDAHEDASAVALGTFDAMTQLPLSGAKSLSDVRSSAARRDAFAAAVTAFRKGDYLKAEQLLDRFLDATPHDARVEDACFIKAVARARSGDTEGAAQLGRAYLERFPNGLRRREAARLAAAHPTYDHR